MSTVENVREALLQAASERFVTTSFPEVTMADVADAAGVPREVARAVFPSVRDAGAAVLDHERESMHAVQAQVAERGGSALDRIVLAFRLVGENLADDVVVRAGVCLASGSRRFFPERRLDPFQTWTTYVDQMLASALRTGELRPGVDTQLATWIVVTAGMGTMDFLRLHDRWQDAPAMLARTAEGAAGLLAVPGRSDRVPPS